MNVVIIVVIGDDPYPIEAVAAATSFQSEANKVPSALRIILNAIFIIINARQCFVFAAMHTAHFVAVARAFDS